MHSSDSSSDPETVVALIDDDGAARRMMRRVLERHGLVVHEASDGQGGVDLVTAILPALVLLDLRMPGALNGLDAARVLRSNPVTAAIPIIVVSASTDSGAREVTEEAGCEAFIEKPVDFTVLTATIDQVLASAHGTES